MTKYRFEVIINSVKKYVKGLGEFCGKKILLYRQCLTVRQDGFALLTVQRDDVGPDDHENVKNHGRCHDDVPRSEIDRADDVQGDHRKSAGDRFSATVFFVEQMHDIQREGICEYGCVE